ncbi:MAG: hydroxyacid dehydrogenase [Burkholderiales bacterium]
MPSTILVTSTELVPEAQSILRQSGASLDFMSERMTEDALASRLSRGDVIAVMMRGSPPFSRRVLSAAKGLRIIAKVGSGLDSVDTDAAAERGITLTTSGVATADAVAEHTLALMLSLARDLPRLDKSTRAGNWEQRNFAGHEFRSRTVGIVGYGQIGRRVARLVSAFGANVLIHPLTQRREVEHGALEESFERLLSTVDILTLHGRLTEETRGQIGKRELALMKPTALLINTARGALVDEAALVEALSTGKLAGAGLDAFAKEPVDRSNPLLALPNVICTSHVAAAAQETVVRVAAMAAQSIVEHLKGASK